MRREDILSALNSFMEMCDDPDIWEELLYLRHNQEEFSDSVLFTRIWGFVSDYILSLKKTDD